MINHVVCCLVKAQQMMMCSCSEISTMMDSFGSAMDGSGGGMLNVTGMCMLLLYPFTSHSINFFSINFLANFPHL